MRRRSAAHAAPDPGGIAVEQRARAAALALTAIASWACATTGGVPRPFPTPGSQETRAPIEGTVLPPPPAADGSPIPTMALVVHTALELQGVPYRSGGTDPDGFDCSGFTQYVFARHDVWLPREVRDQYRVGHPVERRDLRPGDLLFFATNARGPSHVAIALGGDAFVHAPSSTGVVRVERLSATYWSERFLIAKRIG